MAETVGFERPLNRCGSMGGMIHTGCLQVYRQKALFYRLFSTVSDVGVDVLRGGGIGVAQELLGVLYLDVIFVQHGCICMPLRYNYDKPEKPRISRVFGYQARFFILFQPEKSSREVVIS